MIDDRPERHTPSTRKAADLVSEHRISTHDQGGCVEIGQLPDGGVSVRAGTDRQSGPVLTFTREEWVAFVAGVKNGEFDPDRSWSAMDALSSDR